MQFVANLGVMVCHAAGSTSADDSTTVAATGGCGSPSRSWLKILAGDLEEVEYASSPTTATEGVAAAASPIVVRRARLSEGAVTYHFCARSTQTPNPKIPI